MFRRGRPSEAPHEGEMIASEELYKQVLRIRRVILTAIGALVPSDLQDLRTELEAIQSRAASPSKSIHSR